MRAFMSAVNTVERSAYQRTTQQLDIQAEREDRAILAETEPAGYSLGAPRAKGDYLPADGSSALCFSQAWDDARIGLAESLAAFIEQEF